MEANFKRELLATICQVIMTILSLAVFLCIGEWIAFYAFTHLFSVKALNIWSVIATLFVGEIIGLLLLRLMYNIFGWPNLQTK